MKKYAKQTALALAMALTVTSVAPATASAASKPQYKKEYNAVQKGKSYAYTVKNIKKGTKVKWSLVGTGKKYVSFNKSKAVYSEYTKAAKTKTYSTNKVYIRKNTSKVVKVIVRATVTGKNGKKYQVNDKIAIAKTATKPTATPTTTATTAPSTTPSTEPSTTPTATATGAATATPSVAPTATSAATATPSVAPSASTTPSTAPTATASTNPSATPAATATATTTPSAAPVVTNGAITVTSNATGASVKVLNGTTVVATGTIADGKAVLPKVANGNYVVEVSATGFITATKAVVVNGDVTVDVQLQASKEFTAKQTGVKKIVVTGTDLSDQAADYVVKRDNVTVSIDSVAVSADKTTATLTSVATLRAGDYSIEFKTQKYAFKAEDEKAVKFELIGTNLVLTGNNASTATIGYKVLNQFGEKMFDAQPYATCTLGVGAKAEIVTTATATVDGKIEVPVDTTKTPIGTKGTITLVNTTTGLNLNETVTLSAAATVDTIKVAGIYKDYDAEKATKVDALDTKTDLEKSKHAILLKAYDQYGNANASIFTGSAVKISGVGNAGVDVKWNEDNVLTTKPEIVTIDGEEYIAIPLKKTSNLAVGSTTFTIVGIPKGKLGEVVVPVKQAVEVTSLKLVAPVGTAYNGTRTEVSYVAKDTNGNEVTDFNTLQNNTTVKWTSSIDGKELNVHKFEWERQKDGSAKLFFTPNVTFSSTAGERDAQTTVLTTQIGSNIDVTNFTVYNTKKAKAIVGIDKTATKATVASTGSITLKAEDFRFQDQYGNELTDDEVDALLDKDKPVVAVKIIDNKKSGFASIKVNNTELVGAEEADDKKANTVTVKVDGKATEIFTASAKDVKAGKTKLEFALQEKVNNEFKNVTGSEFTDTIQSVEINDISEFEIAELGQLYVKEETVEDGTKVVSGNAVELKVTGKLGATTVALSSDDYKIINTAFELDADKKKIGFKADKLITDDKGNKTSKKETLEIVIKNNAGTSVKKEVTVSSVDPKATTVALDKEKTKKFELSKDRKTEIKVSDIRNLLEVKDQYGNKSKDVARYKYETSNLPDGFKVTANNTDSATLELPDKVTTQTIGVTVTFDSGASYTDTLIINVQ